MIVITGGAGFIGSVLVWKFNEMGVDNLLVVDEKARGSAKWNNVKKRSFVDYLDSDPFIQQLEAGRYDGKITAIFHMGACSDTTERDVEYLRRNNTEYSIRIAEWSLKNKVYLAYASSAATYGDGALGFSDNDKLTPSLKPLNAYGQSKLDFDVWVLNKGAEKKITGFRFFNVYGPNEYHKGAMRSLAHKGYEQIRDTGKLRLFKSYKSEYADGGQKRDFVYVKDVVDAMIWFYDHPEHKGIFNIGSGHAQSWNELAEALFAAAKKPLKIDYIEMPPSIRDQYQYFTEADLAKLRNTTYKGSFRNVRDGVADYAQYLSRPENPFL